MTQFDFSVLGHPITIVDEIKIAGKNEYIYP